MSTRDKSNEVGPAAAKALARRRRTAQRRERESEHETAGARGTGWRINKPKGRVAGNRSACIVLLTAGNRGRRDPSEGRRASDEQGHGWETGRKPEFRISRARNRHG